MFSWGGKDKARDVHKGKKDKNWTVERKRRKADNFRIHMSKYKMVTRGTTNDPIDRARKNALQVFPQTFSLRRKIHCQMGTREEGQGRTEAVVKQRAKTYLTKK